MHNFEGVDEGILREEGVRKIFETHISPLAGQGALKFFCVTEAHRPHVQAKHRALEFKRGYGGRSERNFAIFLGRPRGGADLGPPRE